MIFSSICYIYCDADGDAIAFEKAVQLASQMRAKLDIIAVLEEVPATLLERLVVFRAEREELTGEKELVSRLEQLAATAQSHGVQASFQALRGSPFPLIVERVSLRAHDLVIKGTQPGKGYLGR